jgi:hypothetical protein
VGRGREGEGNGGGCGKLTSGAASNDTGDRSDLMAFGDSNGFQFRRQAVSWGGGGVVGKGQARALATATGWDSEEGSEGRRRCGCGCRCSDPSSPLCFLDAGMNGVFGFGGGGERAQSSAGPASG